MFHLEEIQYYSQFDCYYQHFYSQIECLSVDQQLCVYLT